MAALVDIVGDKELAANLKMLGTRGSKAAARSGVNAGLVVMAKAMRSAVNGTGASPELKRAARQAIGKSFKKKSKTAGPIEAKVGFAVAKSAKQIGKAMTRKGTRSKGGGLGMTAANIHWAVLGTDERTQDTTGRKTGKMPAVFAGVTDAALAVGPAAAEAAKAKSWAYLERVAKKRGISI